MATGGAGRHVRWVAYALFSSKSANVGIASGTGGFGGAVGGSDCGDMDRAKGLGRPAYVNSGFSRV